MRRTKNFLLFLSSRCWRYVHTTCHWGQHIISADSRSDFPLLFQDNDRMKQCCISSNKGDENLEAVDFLLLWVWTCPPCHYRTPSVCGQRQPVINIRLPIVRTRPSTCLTKTTCCTRVSFEPRTSVHGGCCFRIEKCYVLFPVRFYQKVGINWKSKKCDVTTVAFGC